MRGQLDQGPSLRSWVTIDWWGVSQTTRTLVGCWQRLRAAADAIEKYQIPYERWIVIGKAQQQQTQCRTNMVLGDALGYIRIHFLDMFKIENSLDLIEFRSRFENNSIENISWNLLTENFSGYLQMQQSNKLSRAHHQLLDFEKCKKAAQGFSFLETLLWIVRHREKVSALRHSFLENLRVDLRIGSSRNHK